MDDIERKVENLSEEIDALLLVWNVDPAQINSVILSEAIKHIMSSLYSLYLVFKRLQRIKSSSSGVELENTELAIDIIEKEIDRLYETIQKLVPQVPEREFNLGVISVLKGIDLIIHPEDE